MKRWFKNFLNKLGETNQKNFGSERMDCCNVNKKGNGFKSTKYK